MAFFTFYQKRRQQLAETSKNLGFNFSINNEYGLIGMMKDFDLFKKGYSKRINNIISNTIIEEFEKTDIRIFDFKYTVGGGNSTRRIAQTVFYVHSKSLRLPQFYIGPERFYHRIGKWLGMQDIDFNTFPKFSNQFLVQGPEEDLIRKALNKPLLQMLVQEKNYNLEGINYLLVFYKYNTRIAPEQIASFYQKGNKILELLKQ